jgi:hypothetical protein
MIVLSRYGMRTGQRDGQTARWGSGRREGAAVGLPSCPKAPRQGRGRSKGGHNRRRSGQRAGASVGRRLRGERCKWQENLDHEASGTSLSCRQHGGMRSLTSDASMRRFPPMSRCAPPQFNLLWLPNISIRPLFSLPSRVPSHQRGEDRIRWGRHRSLHVGTRTVGHAFSQSIPFVIISCVVYYNPGHLELIRAYLGLSEKSTRAR